MTDDRDLLRRRLLAVSEVNRELQDRLDATAAIPRTGEAEPWLDALTPAGRAPIDGDAAADATEPDVTDRADDAADASAADAATEPDPAPFLVRAEGGTVHLIDAGSRRAVASGLLATLLERQLGERRRVDDVELDQWPPGPPIEVMEAPDGPPFIVVAGVRRPLRGLPLPHPVDRTDADRFQVGAELDLAAVLQRPGKADRAKADAEESSVGPLPTFLIIGAQKSATRWLRANLGQHPDVYAAPSELEFFNNDNHFQNQGPRWYRAQFGAWDGEPIVGEATPGYMMWHHQPEVMARRIRKVVPDVRLIAILRNPIDRAYSAMVHHIKRERLRGDAKLVDLARATPPEEDYLGLIAGGWYAASLRPFARLFGDQLLVLFHDDIDADARGVYAKALSHIGADPQFVPRNLRKVRFSNQAERPAEDDPLSPAERRELYEYFRQDVDELAVMLGRDLSSWDPSATTSVEDADEAAADPPQGSPVAG